MAKKTINDLVKSKNFPVEGGVVMVSLDWRNPRISYHTDHGEVGSIYAEHLSMVIPGTVTTSVYRKSHKPETWQVDRPVNENLSFIPDAFSRIKEWLNGPEVREGLAYGCRMLIGKYESKDYFNEGSPCGREILY